VSAEGASEVTTVTPADGKHASAPLAKRDADQSLRASALSTSDPETTAKAVSESHGIVLAHEPNGGQSSVRNRDQWNEAVRRWKKELPPVQSVYQPSGRLPPKALALMILGGSLGIPAGAASAAAVAGITALLVYLLGAVFVAIAEALDVFVCCPLVLMIIVVALGGLAALIAWGCVPAMCVVSLGRQGKNRNVGVSVVVSAMSALGAVLVLALLVPSLDLDFLPGSLRDGLPWWLILLLLIVPLVAACGTALGETVEAKFCETCEVFMDKKPLVELSYGGARLMALAIKEADFLAVAGAMEIAKGNVGRPLLFTCPECHSGCLDLTMAFSASWQRPDKPEQNEEASETWIAASCSVPPKSVEVLRRFRKGRAS